MQKKKEVLMNIYNTRKSEAEFYYDNKKYENALAITSGVAEMMYRLNFFYVDDDLEEILEGSAKNYISFQGANVVKDEKVIAFYDGVGFDTRGLATNYLNALIDNGYHVMYITKANVEIPTIQKIIERDSKSKRFFIEKATYKEETEKALQIIKAANAKALFVYDREIGIVGSLLAFALKGSGILSYKIVLGDHAFWLGARATDYFIEFRDYGANISSQYRKIPKEKLIKLPFYPELNKDIPFQGYPFEVKENNKVIFSGGALYKTFDEENLYYEIVEEILKKYQDVIFWYAGAGDSSEIKKLIKKYPDRVYFTSERKDLFQVMKHCYFYLSTYPLSGGLMTQYAASAGKIPVTLLCNKAGNLMINHAELLECEFYTKEELLLQVDKLIKNEEYLHQVEKNTKGQVIEKKEFSEELNMLLKFQKTKYFIHYDKISEEEIEKFSDWYLENY